MKHKLLAAPLLSLALVLLFFQPLDKSDRTPKIFPLTPNRNNFQKLADSGVQNRPSLVTLASIPTFEPVDMKALNAAGAEIDTLGFGRFIARVSDGQVDSVTGVHVPGVLELPVIQQPTNDGVFVSSDLDVATQFRSAAKHGVTGLLAHNYLSGRLFYNLSLDQDVHLIYGDGGVRTYQVDRIERYQKLDPSSLRSDLVELSTGRRMTTAEVYKRYYTGGDHVTFQTCLWGEGISNWGLIFITASPID